MTSRRRLVPSSEIRRAIALAQELGLPIGAVDIRTDGVTIHPPAATATPQPGESAYDRWKNVDANRARPPHN